MFSHLYSRSDFAEIYTAAQIEIKPTVENDLGVHQRYKAVKNFQLHAALPYRFGQHRLQHACVHSDERGMEKMQRQCRSLLIAAMAENPFQSSL